MVSSTLGRWWPAWRREQSRREVDRPDQAYKPHGGMVAQKVARRAFVPFTTGCSDSCGLQAGRLAAPRCPGGSDDQRAINLLLRKEWNDD